jgi:hypothetical protein
MGGVKNILIGTINHVKSGLDIADEEIEKMAKSRMEICYNHGGKDIPCQYKMQNSGNPKCAMCGCYLKKKTRVPEEKCPKELW